jgi:hypothetical protein
MMNKFFRKIDPSVKAELESLEASLAATLIPVKPRPEFVRDLRTQLFDLSPEIEPKTAPPRFQNILLIVGGILGGLLMVIASIRGLISLIGVTGLILQHFRRQGRAPQPISSP